MKTFQSVVLIVVLHLLEPYSAVRCDWDIEILDTEGFGEGASSLFIDQHDGVFVAYAPGWNYRILHKDGGPWLGIPAPDSIRSLREYVDMEVASDGRIHVVFDAYAANELNSRVWHDEWDGGSWVITPVSEGWEPSLALGPDSNPMVGFALPGGMAFGSRSDTSWQLEPVDSLTGWESSITSDSRSNPHISYYAFRSGQPPILKYTTRDSSGWHTEIVDDGGDRGHMSALALDSNENPHIAYIAWFPEIDPDSLEVWYAYRAGGGWRIEVVDRWDGLEPPGWFWDGQITLALDSDDVPHIAYRNEDQLYYAKRDPSTGDWSREVVDPSPGTGRYASVGPGFEPIPSHQLFGTFRRHPICNPATRRDP